MPMALAEMGRWLFLWTEVASLVVTDGYRAAEREVLARDTQARRGALQELLGVIATDTTTSCPPAPGRGPVRAGPGRRIPDRGDRPAAGGRPDPRAPGPGPGSTSSSLPAGSVTWSGRAAAGIEGAGAGIRLPVVLPMRGPDRAARRRMSGPGSPGCPTRSTPRSAAPRAGEAGAAAAG